MLTNELIDAYADCCTAIENGASVEAALARYPHWAAELRPLLGLAEQIPALGQTATPTRSAQTASRAEFLARAASFKAVSTQKQKPGAFRWRPAFTGLGLALVVLVSGYGLVSASTTSLPGDPLYGLKRTVEQVQLLLTLDSEGQDDLQTEFEERRRGEAEAVTEVGRAAQVEFKGLIEAIAGNTWQVAGISVEIASSTQVEGQPAVGRLAEVHGLAQTTGVVLASEISIEDAVENEAETESEPTEGAPASATATRTLVAITATATSLPPSATNSPVAVATVTSTSRPAPSATSVPTATPPPATEAEGQEIEFSGVIESISGAVWRIAGQDVTVGVATELEGNLQVGGYVKVEARRLANGTLLAKHIERQDSPEASPTGASQTVTRQPSETREPTEEPESTESPEPSETPRP